MPMTVHNERYLLLNSLRAGALLTEIPLLSFKDSTVSSHGSCKLSSMEN